MRGGSLDSEDMALIRLLSLPGMGPARLRWLTSSTSAVEVMGALENGRLPKVSTNPPRGITEDVKQQWFRAITSNTGGHAMHERLVSESVEIVTPASPFWPFADDPEPPPLLFCRGDTSLLARRPAVAIVGTRRCTSLGRRVAIAMAETLVRAGVMVVSGLALGIDGAAHGGAFQAATEGGAPVLGVVATGLDVVYPLRHGSLWQEVGERGLLVSEAPLGIAPARWRFPARNRIIAALADAVVVVESHEKGGALSTVDEAIERGVPVLVVPGSVLSPASSGTNALLMEGAVPVRNGDDVLELLGLAATVEPEDHLSTDAGPPLSATNRKILAELASGSATLDDLASATQLSVQDLLSRVQTLALDDLVVLEGSRVRLS